MSIESFYFDELADFLLSENRQRSVEGRPLLEFSRQAIRDLSLPKKFSLAPDRLFAILREALSDYHGSVGDKNSNQALFKFLDDRVTNIGRANYHKLIPFIFKWLWNYDRATALYILERVGFDYWDMLLAERRSAGEPTTKTDIFICWSGEYAEAIASEVREFFQPYADVINVFLSSADIQRGVWRDRLRGGLAKATEGIVIATQDMLDSQYVQYEFALLSEKAEDPLILLFGCPRTVLPAQMQPYHCVDYSRKRLEGWVKRVLSPLETFPTDQFEALIQKLEATIEQYGPRFVTSDPERWTKEYHRPLGMATQKDSPFDLEQTIKVAQQRLMLVAQNHWYMTDAKMNNQPKFWLLLKDALRRGVNVEIAAMHEAARPPGKAQKNIPDAVDVWGLYLEKREQFREQLKEAWQTFEQWNAFYAKLRATEQNMGKLIFYGVYFAPVTMTFVDPDAAKGFVVISPRPASRESGDRPQIVLRRRWEPSLFGYYWRTVEDSKGNANWFKPFPDPDATERLPSQA
jgi:hypothetical protein